MDEIPTQHNESLTPVEKKTESFTERVRFLREKTVNSIKNGQAAIMQKIRGTKGIDWSEELKESDEIAQKTARLFGLEPSELFPLRTPDVPSFTDIGIDIEKEEQLAEKKKTLDKWVDSIEDPYVKQDIQSTVNSYPDMQSDFITDNQTISPKLLLRILKENSGNYRVTDFTDRLLQSDLVDTFPEEAKRFWQSWLHLDQFYKSRLLGVVRIANEANNFERLYGLAQVCVEMQSFMRQPVLSQLVVEPFLHSENPQETLENTVDVITSDSMPDAVKIFALFQNRFFPTYDREQGTFAQEKSKRLSPTLMEVPEEEAYKIIFTDLVRLHVESGNFSMRQFLSSTLESQAILDKAKSEGFDSLAERDRLRLASYCRQAEMLSVTPFLRLESSENVQTNEDNKLEENIQAVEKRLSLSAGQKITDKMVEVFARPIGLSSLEDVLARMDEVGVEARERNSSKSNIEDGHLVQLKSGDILKTISPNHLAGIIDEGVASGEFILGLTQQKVNNPFSSDVVRVMPEDEQGKFLQAFEAFFGEEEKPYVIVVRDRGQFHETAYSDKTTLRQNDETDETSEIFSAGQKRHFAIRTGFPPSQIDAIILGRTNIAEGAFRSNLEKTQFLVGQAGLDIPIADKDGNVLVSPEDYLHDQQIINELCPRLQSDSFDPHDFIDSLKTLPMLKSLYEMQVTGTEGNSTIQDVAEATMQNFEQLSSSNSSSSIISNGTMRLALILKPLGETKAFQVQGQREVKDMYAKTVLPLMMRKLEIPLEEIQIVTRVFDSGILDEFKKDSGDELIKGKVNELAESLAIPMEEIEKLIKVIVQSEGYIKKTLIM